MTSQVMSRYAATTKKIRRTNVADTFSPVNAVGKCRFGRL